MKPLTTALAVCAALAATNTAAQDAGSKPLDELLATPVSTAARYEQRLADTPAAVTVITAEEIARYGWETLAEVLNAVRGLYISYDRNYTYLGIRGFSRPTDYNNRLLVMIDGHSINEHTFGSAGIGSELGLDLADVERIEFVRGPGSVLYGSGAMLGVVNIITHKSHRHHVRAEISMGSAGRVGGSVSMEERFGETQVRLSMNRRSTEGRDLYFPELNESVVRDRDFDDVTGILASLTHRDLAVRSFLSHRRKGIPTGAYETDLKKNSETTDEVRFVDVLYEPRLSDRWQVELRAFRNWYVYFGEYTADYTFIDEVHGLFTGAEARALFDVRSNHRLTVGAQYIDEQRTEYGEQGGDILMANRDVASIYAQHEYQPSEKLSLVGGLRYDRVDSYRGRITPRVAVVYHPTADGALKLLYGEAFRNPTPWEREYELPGTWLSNLGLRDENIRTTEIVWEQRISPEVLAVVSAYRYTVTDLIDQYTVSEDPWQSQYVNRGSVSSVGIETELNYRSASGLWTYLHYSHQKAEEKGDWLTNSPRNIATAGASSPLEKRLMGAIEVIYESGRRTLAGTQTDALTVVNATLSARLGLGMKVVAQMRNAFDANYSVPGGAEHRQAAIEQDGRSFILRLVYQR